MDILGKEAEKAEEDVKQLGKKVEKLESHLDAVDAALQDFQTDVQKVLEEELQYQEDEIWKLKDALGIQEDQEIDIRKLEKRLNSLESQVKSLETNIQAFLESDIHESLSDMIKGVKTTRNFMHDLEDRITKIDNRIDDVESQMLVEINNRDYDFDKKMDERDYEEDKKQMEKKINGLRASINVLADELDKKDEIEVEE